MLQPGAVEHVEAAHGHDDLAGRPAGLAAEQGEDGDDHVNAQVGVLAHADDGPDKGHPDEGETGDFLGKVDAGVEAQTQDDIHEHQHEHDDHVDDQNDFQNAVKTVDQRLQELFHACCP